MSSIEDGKARRKAALDIAARDLERGKLLEHLRGRLTAHLDWLRSEEPASQAQVDAMKRDLADCLSRIRAALKADMPQRERCVETLNEELAQLEETGGNELLREAIGYALSVLDPEEK